MKTSLFINGKETIVKGVKVPMTVELDPLYVDYITRVMTYDPYQLKRPSKRKMLKRAMEVYQYYRQYGSVSFPRISPAPISNEAVVLLAIKLTGNFSNKQMKKIIKSAF